MDGSASASGSGTDQVNAAIGANYSTVGDAMQRYAGYARYVGRLEETNNKNIAALEEARALEDSGSQAYLKLTAKINAATALGNKLSDASSVITQAAAGLTQSQSVWQDQLTSFVKALDSLNSAIASNIGQTN